MLTIQWILIPTAVFIAIVEFVRFFRVASRLRLFHALLWTIVAVTVFKPSLVQSLADAVNVGRGTDFVLYGLVIYTLMFSFYVMRHNESQRQLMTGLVRQLAIRDAIEPTEDVATPDVSQPSP